MKQSNDHFILMGDVVKSREYQAASLRKHFLELIDGCNEALEGRILSPYTVTLGDEFQGVADSLEGALQAVFHLEETALQTGLNFRIRYVLGYGPIETEINRQKAHAMMGPGLTRVRELLTEKKRGGPRFRFELETERQSRLLENLFRVIDCITRDWKWEDIPLIFAMLSESSDAEVGKKFDKDRSLIWKRRKNLMVEEYRALKESAFLLSAFA